MSPAEHGGDPRLDYVLEVLVIDHGEKIIYSSDVKASSPPVRRGS